jgi:hypothetical protein
MVKLFKEFLYACYAISLLIVFAVIAGALDIHPLWALLPVVILIMMSGYYFPPQKKEEDVSESPIENSQAETNSNEIEILEGFIFILWLLYVLVLFVTGYDAACYASYIQDPSLIISIGKTTIFLTVASFIFMAFADEGSKSYFFFYLATAFLLPATISIVWRCYL